MSRVYNVLFLVKRCSQWWKTGKVEFMPTIYVKLQDDFLIIFSKSRRMFKILHSFIR